MTKQERMQDLAHRLMDFMENSPEFGDGERVMISVCCNDEDSTTTGSLAMSGYENSEPRIAANDISQMLLTLSRVMGAEFRLMPIQIPRHN